MGHAVATKEIDGITLQAWEAVNAFGQTYQAGYARFPHPLLKQAGYGGIVDHVPVYGGVTYAEIESDGRMVYGFDCAHPEDAMGTLDLPKPIYKRRDPAWILRECERMVLALQVAAKYEQEFDETDDKEEVIRQYHDCLRTEHGLEFEKPNRMAQGLRDVLQLGGLNDLQRRETERLWLAPVRTMWGDAPVWD